MIQVSAEGRSGARPAFEGELPAGASDFTPALGSFSQGLEHEGAGAPPQRHHVRFTEEHPVQDDGVAGLEAGEQTPPRQKAASFTIDQVMQKMQSGASGGGHTD